MANRWKGNFIIATEATSSGTAYTGKANGAWSLNNQIQQKQANLWAKGVGAPTAPTIRTATAGNANASVAFTASSDTGGPGSLTYTATSTPGSFTNTGSSSPIVVSGLTNGTQYTFKVKATNSLGYVSPDSADSNSTGVTVPGAPTIGTATASNTTATIQFTPPSNTGGLPIIDYTATSSIGSITGTAASSPITVSGLTNGTTYTFTVVATNAVGNSSPSSPSNSVVPTGFTDALIFVDGAGSVSLGATKIGVTSGYGTRYANPSPILGVSYGAGLSVSRTRKAIVTGPLGASPYINAFAWSNAGFGTKYNAPSTLPPALNGKYALGNGLVFANVYNSPYLAGYVWSDVSGFGTKLANPSALPTGIQWDIQLNSAGTALIGTGDAAGPTAYYVSSSGFGTKYANPSGLTDKYIRTSKFNYPNTAIALGRIDQADGCIVINWNDTTGFGTTYASPSTLPGFTIANSCFSVDNTFLVHSGYASPYIAAYQWNNGYGTKYTNPSTLPNSSIETITINSLNNMVSVGTNTAGASGGIVTYPWDNGFGTIISKSSDISSVVAVSSDSLSFISL